MNLTQPSRRASATAASVIVALLVARDATAQETTTETPASPVAVAPQVAPADVKIAGQDVPVPTRRKYVAPEYPADAAIKGIRGIVILELVIGEDGRVESVRVTRSIPGLDEAAVSAVRLWEYEPTKLAGKRVKVRHSQSITFSAKLPDLQRAPGIPELKSGGAPPVPRSLESPETASIEVTLGTQGEVREAAVLEGRPALSEALLRAVRAWRFVLSEGSAPLSFTVRADWTPGPRPTLTLKALDLKATTASAATPATPPVIGPAPLAGTSPAPTTSTGTSEDVAGESDQFAPLVDTEVLTARPEPPAKEEGVSGIPDVVLGENIPGLVRGRRPVWPPLARLGNITGEVVVRFSVDLAGRVSVHSAEGPERLKASAEQAVGTWQFHRTAIDRVDLIATFKFATDRTVAKVERAPLDQS